MDEERREANRPDPRVVARHPQEPVAIRRADARAAGRSGARGRVNPGARNVVAGVFLSVPEIVSIVSELVSNDSSLGNDTVMYISVKAIT